MFEQEAITKVVKEALVNVPEDHKVAMVTIANNDGVKAVVAAKIDDEWQIDFYGNYSIPKKHFDYGVVVQWSK